MNRFDCLTEKQKQLTLILLVEPDFNVVAERLRISKRSVYRRAANIRKRILKNCHLDVAPRPKMEE